MISRQEQARRCGGAGPSATAVDGQSFGSGNDHRETMPADLYAQSEAVRRQSRLLAVQLRESQRRTMENWQLVQAAWERTHEICTARREARTDPDRLRYSAYARVQAKLASLPVIEQAKGIIMAQCGWSEAQAFDALRRASQRENIKVRDLAARVVASTVSSAPARRQAVQAPTTTRPRDESASSVVSADLRKPHRESA